LFLFLTHIFECLVFLSFVLLCIPKSATKIRICFESYNFFPKKLNRVAPFPSLSPAFWNRVNRRCFDSQLSGSLFWKCFYVIVLLFTPVSFPVRLFPLQWWPSW
jgi:hypothetical protein